MTPRTPGDVYEVTIVRYGTRSATKSEVYLNHHIYREPDAPVGMDYFFWIIRNGQRTVLVDTGFSQHGGNVRNRTFLLEPAKAYDALGVRPEDAPPIIVTHAHYDHIGNLSLMPQSEIVIAAREYEFWAGPLGHRAQFHYSVEDDELATLAKAHADGRVTAFDSRHVVAPGIDVIEVGGHTPGQSVVLVQTSAGPVLLASDAVHYYQEYEADMPFAFVADLPAMYGGFDQIRSWCADGIVEHLVSGHDPDTLARFTPASGPLSGHAATIGALR